MSAHKLTVEALIPSCIINAMDFRDVATAGVTESFMQEGN